jgi:hypothetical protein
MLFFRYEDVEIPLAKYKLPADDMPGIAWLVLPI